MHNELALKANTGIFRTLLLAALATALSANLAVAARADQSSYKTELQSAADGAGVITIRASTPGKSWASPGPAPVLDALLDGRLVSNIVLFAGSEPFEYRILAGDVAKGKHTLEIKPRLSRKSDWPHKIDSAALDIFSPGSPQYNAYLHSPLIYGREENNISDVPLHLWVETFKNDAGSDYKYSFIWSNEDGGTKTASLMARYGRAVDTEHAITVSVDASGKVTAEPFQTFNHKIAQFSGKHKGLRPILIVATQNNVFADVGKSTLLFSYAPEIRPPLPDVREAVLDENPWIYRVMAEELEKENKISQPGDQFDITKTEDPRTFIYIDINLASMLPEFKAEIAVKLKGGDWQSSSRGNPALAQNLSGWSRVAVPAGRMPAHDEIDAIRVSLFDPKSGARISVRELKRIIVLGADYAPRVMPLNLKPMAELSPGRSQWSVSPPLQAK